MSNPIDRFKSKLEQNGEREARPNELTQLRQRVAVLEKKLARNPDPETADERAARRRSAANLGGVVDPRARAIAEMDEYEARQRKRRELMEGEAEDAERRSREGLPAGMVRDPCGIVRTRDGAVAPNAAVAAQRELEDAAARAEIAAEHHERVSDVKEEFSRVREQSKAARMANAQANASKGE